MLQADTAAKRRSLEQAFGPMLAGGAHPGLRYLLTHKLLLVRSYPAAAHAPLLLIRLLVAADAAAALAPGPQEMGLLATFLLDVFELWSDEYPPPLPLLNPIATLTSPYRLAKKILLIPPPPPPREPTGRCSRWCPTRCSDTARRCCFSGSGCCHRRAPRRYTRSCSGQSCPGCRTTSATRSPSSDSSVLWCTICIDLYPSFFERCLGRSSTISQLP